jgi:hypothetical protein
VAVVNERRFGFLICGCIKRQGMMSAREEAHLLNLPSPQTKILGIQMPNHSYNFQLSRRSLASSGDEKLGGT